VTITLLLKLLAPIVLLISALMQAGLDYLWKDHRTKTHKRARALFLVLLLVSGVFSIVIVVMGDQDGNDLKNQLGSLERKLDPFLELAKARFPGLDSTAALQRLSAEIKELEGKTKSLEKTSIEEKTQRQALAKQLDSEQRKVRDFGVDLTVDFSGDWSQEPWGHLISSASDEFYTYLWSRTDKSNMAILKFFATQPYDFVTTGKGRARFQARQAVRRGEAPLGTPIDVLSRYDTIGLWIPFLDYKQLTTREIIISRIEIVFTFNGKRGRPVILAGPLKSSVELVKGFAWAGATRSLDPIIWKEMWTDYQDTLPHPGL
jgi:hypothetical protein